MTTTQIALDKKAHPLMMHLSILSKYEISKEQSSYNPSTQISNITSMAPSWCTRNSSTGSWTGQGDEDQQEDD